VNGVGFEVVYDLRQVTIAPKPDATLTNSYIRQVGVVTRTSR
jgi:hypothetical protein